MFLKTDKSLHKMQFLSRFPVRRSNITKTLKCSPRMYNAFLTFLNILLTVTISEVSLAKSYFIFFFIKLEGAIQSNLDRTPLEPQ